tara:strand:+ start:350 stop:1108 length:759 start_codon:yes stop_codon:yes gene_type:complete
MNSTIYPFFIVLYALFSCNEPIVKKEIKGSLKTEPAIELTELKICDWDSIMQKSGLVNILKIDPSLKVNLKYSSEDNFMKKDVYGCLENCYLQPDVAEKLKMAQLYLKAENKDLSLLIWDGTRPRSVQKHMWNLLDMPDNEKVNFVSDPKFGSLHNFGAAIDLTIYDLKDEKLLDMGTEYDHFGVLAWPIKEKEMLKQKRLDQNQINNRQLLRKVMSKAGFYNLKTEWWHFNSLSRSAAAKKYSIIEGEIKP